ncbi:MAG: hypothetical protein JWR52_470 [Marmoricola sp.]|nr:hypothetical protein [Marmoricola sp.]
MTTAPGRRVQIPAGRPAVLGLMVVALTAAMLTLAGTTPRSLGAAPTDTSRVALAQRTFSCTGGIPGATATSGNLVGGLAAASTLGSSPRTIVADRNVAGAAFAGQVASNPRWLAWLPCPEPRASWWFVGAGGAAVTHDTVLTLTNPRPGAAVVDVDVFGPTGVVASPGLHGLTLATGTSQVLDLAKLAPTIGTAAVRVVAKRGLVAVSAADRLSPGLLGKQVREWLPPQSLPATSITLAGLPPSPGSSNLILVNPGSSEAVVHLEVISSSGTFVPTSYTPVTVAPYSTATVGITKVFDGTPMSLLVTSPQPVTATVRSVVGGDVTYATGVATIQGSTAFAVPPGTGQLVLSSLGAGTTYQVTVYNAAGARLSSGTVTVPARGSVAVPLRAKSAYVSLVAHGGSVVAGFEMSSGKGVTAAGVTPSITSTRLPSVRQGW